MLQDFRFALRLFAKSPGFTVLAVLTLAVAIGTNSAIFALVNGVILQPMVARRPAELVSLFTARTDAERDYRQFTHAEFAALRGTNPVFQDTAAMAFTLTGVGERDQQHRAFLFLTSDNYLEVFGVSPARGRFFTAEECRPGARIAVAFASHAVWERSGRREDFVGSTVWIGGHTYTIVGVAPKGFSGGNAIIAPDFWLPLGAHELAASSFEPGRARPLDAPRNFALNLIARLQPGQSAATAASALAVLSERLAASVREDEFARRLEVHPVSRFAISTEPQQENGLGLIGGLLAGMAACVLLIACLNLANMLLARGTARRREFAIRLAVGAGRRQIVRQLVFEGFLLSLAGGAMGLVLSLWTNDLLLTALRSILPMQFSLVLDVGPRAPVLLATLAACAAATLLFSLGPALRLTRGDLAQDLKQGSADAHAGHWNRFFSGRHVLVMTQIALTLMLLFASGLFVRGALNAGGAEPGFATSGRLVADIDLALARVPEDQRRAVVDAVIERVAALPGVAQVAVTSQLPYANMVMMRDVARLGEAVGPDRTAKDASVGTLYSAVSPGYFAALGVPLVRGRDFVAADAAAASARQFAVIDENLAHRLYPDREALGQVLESVQADEKGVRAQFEIVGIVKPHRHDAISDSFRNRLFVVYGPAQPPALSLVIALAPGAAAHGHSLAPAIRRAIAGAHPNLPVFSLRTIEQVIDSNATLFMARLGAVLFGAFGGIALLLAIVGVYGVKAYAVARRVREIGIRMAIGARPADVLRLLLGQGLAQVATGLAVGALLALGLGQALASLLYEVKPFDPLSLGAAALLLGGAALVATWLPARRAVRVDPARVLRAE